VHATDPRRRMWHWLQQVKNMGFSGVNNFPTHCIVDGHFRGVLEETGMSVQKEFEMVGLATKMDMFSIVYVATPEEAVEMVKNGADAVIAHVGTTVGGSIGVVNAVVDWDFTVKRTQEIIDAAPTDGLWSDGRTDEDQLGMTYPELELAMTQAETNSGVDSVQEKKNLKQYRAIRARNLHKMTPIPVCQMPVDQ
jgi:hypothetical protein